MRLLSCTCHQSILGGLVVGAWLTLFLVAPGSGALSGVLVKVGGGALRLAVAGDVVQLCISEWLLPVDSTVIVSCVEVDHLRIGWQLPRGGPCLVGCPGCGCRRVQRPLLF